MANIIRIKRSNSAGTPSSLAEGEMAHSFTSGDTFIGGVGGASVIKIGGSTDVTKLSGIEAGADITDATNVAAAGAIMDADITANGYMLRTGAGTYTSVGTNRSATVAPTASNDNTEGYGVGSAWIDITNDKAYIMLDASTGAAIWKDITTSSTADMVGPGSATNSAIALFDGTTGKLLKDSVITVDGSGNLTTAGTIDGRDVSADGTAQDSHIADVANPHTVTLEQARTGGSTFSGAINMGSNLISGLATPVSSTDAANKSYVDAIASSLDVKDSCRVATTGNVTLSGEQTIDGISTGADRILVKDQTAGAENGIYVTAAGAWTRSSDADNTPSGEVTSGMFTFIEEGTANANAGFVLATADPIVLDTTVLTFTQFSGAGQIVAGNGMTKTGNQIDVVGTASRISVAADSIDISASYVGQASITTLGTIGTGTWQGSVIAVAYGGTGVATITAGALLKGAGTSAMVEATAGTDYLDNVSNIDGGTF